MGKFFSAFAGVLYAGHVKLFAEVSELFLHAVLQLLPTTKQCLWSAFFRRSKRWKSGYTKLEL
jgi:hypothetical protein